jgi:hypothetical protein
MGITMDTLNNILLFAHVMSFVFMTIPLFNLIVVNERAALNLPFNYHVDRYMENILGRGALRCFTFQMTVLISGLLLLKFGPLEIDTLWTNWVVMLKTALLFVLMGLLSYVHFSIQPRIESLMTALNPDDAPPEEFLSRLKPLRARRKKLATVCLFVVITLIILGLQVYETFDPLVTTGLVALAGIFSLNVNRTLIKFGWI